MCGGRGVVPSGFYAPPGLTGASSTVPTEACRSCDGRGVIWGFEIDPPSPVPFGPTWCTVPDIDPETVTNG